MTQTCSLWAKIGPSDGRQASPVKVSELNKQCLAACISTVHNACSPDPRSSEFSDLSSCCSPASGGTGRSSLLPSCSEECLPHSQASQCRELHNCCTCRQEQGCCSAATALSTRVGVSLACQVAGACKRPVLAYWLDTHRCCRAWSVCWTAPAHVLGCIQTRQHVSYRPEALPPVPHCAQQPSQRDFVKECCRPWPRALGQACLTARV